MRLGATSSYLGFTFTLKMKWTNESNQNNYVLCKFAGEDWNWTARNMQIKNWFPEPDLGIVRTWLQEKLQLTLWKDFKSIYLVFKSESFCQSLLYLTINNQSNIGFRILKFLSHENTTTNAYCDLYFPALIQKKTQL
jgi:hypothetical protein